MTKETPATEFNHLGPRPLALHLALQTISWTGSLCALESLRNGSLNWSPRLATQANELVTNLQGIAPDAFRGSVEEQSRRRLIEFANGVRSYRKFNRDPRHEEPPVIWSEGTTRLLDYGRGAKGRPIVFVPSLVNRGYILDLSERRSLLRDLSGRGYRPLLVDWGAPGKQETEFSLDDYIAGRLSGALQAAHDLDGQPVTLAGYCMGGLLTLALAAIHPEWVSALVLMATPWDVHAMETGKTRMLEAMIPAINSVLEVTSSLPVDVLQAMFVSLDPNLTANKFRTFAAMNKRSARAKNFVALEDWINDGVPLAGPTAKDCLIDWYVKNKPGRSCWKIAGKTVRPEEMNIPSLVIVPTQDHIVPPGTALPLVKKLPISSCLKIKAGHIGMVAGSRAKGTLYSPMAQWLDNILS